MAMTNSERQAAYRRKLIERLETYSSALRAIGELFKDRTGPISVQVKDIVAEALKDAKVH